MFSTLKQRLLLGVYIFLVLSIPIGAYLTSQYQSIKSSAQEVQPSPQPVKVPKPSISPAKELLSLSKEQAESNPSSDEEASSPTIATSFGPTLSLKAIFEGRPQNNQAGKLFVGIVEGSLTSNPKFLLSFTVDLPASGEYSNLSLAGLSPGKNFTALLKGYSQIATSSAFLMSPSTTNLNEGNALTMLSGDLNDDNTINSADYSIAQRALGSTPSSSNWNENADFNKDGVINIFDMAFITKNFGKIGDSGSWLSPLPKSATPSAGLASPLNPASGGYWMWIPK